MTDAERPEAAAVAPGIAPREPLLEDRIRAWCEDDATQLNVTALELLRPAEHEIRALREQQVCPKHSLAGIGWCQPCAKEREQAEVQLAATRAALIALRDRMQAEYNDRFVAQRTTQIWSVTLKRWIDELTQAAGLPK